MALFRPLLHHAKIILGNWRYYVMGLLAALPLIDLIVVGYAMRFSVSQEEGLPELIQWWGMFLDGLRLLAVTLLWCLPLGLLILLFTLLGPDTWQDLGGLFIGGFSALAVLWVFPALLLVEAREAWSGLRPSRVFSTMSLHYLLGWLVLLSVNLLLLLPGRVLPLLYPFITTLILLLAAKILLERN